MRIMHLPIAVPALLFAASFAHAETITGLASVIDADTIQINGEVIRLLDVDAPQRDQLCSQALGDVTWECGREAAFALIDWIGATAVQCETDGLDRYKRHLARCSVGGDDVAVWLADGGWAVPDQNCKCEAVRAASGHAAALGRGIWIEPFVLSWGR
jgi:endonuclease YncB( thermonuclease family)